jgi:mRNA interferase RelE/StbE
MAWQIEFSRDAERQLSKLDTQKQKLIRNYLKYRVSSLDHPTLLGKALQHDLKGCWRYKVGKLRIICSIENNELIVLVIAIGSRDKIYD